MVAVMNSKINYMKWILVDQIYDLTAPIKIMREFVAQEGFDPSSKNSMAVFRLCNHALIITLSKLYELLTKYKDIVNAFPEEISIPCTQIRKSIESKDIYGFRNKYAAHLFDKNTKEPISIKAGQERLAKILGENIEEMLSFYNWIDPIDRSDQTGVLPVLQKTLEHCKSVLGPGWERP